MAARGPQTGSQPQHGLLVLPGVGADLLQMQQAAGQCACLVDYQRGQIGQLFQEGRTAHQDAVARCYSNAGNGRCRG